MTDPNKVAVQYIGKRESFLERLYGSDLTFAPQQIRIVPSLLARKLLKHTDLFCAAEAPKGKAKTGDDTEELLEESRKSREASQRELDNLQDLHDQVNAMEKDSLKEFAFTHFQQNIDLRKSVESLRGSVHQMINQFGVA